MTQLAEPLARVMPELVSSGATLEPEHLGWLRDSNDALDDLPELHQRMERDGYLFMPGLLNRQEIIDTRKIVTDRLAELHLLDPAHPSIEAVAAKGIPINSFIPEKLAADNPALDRVLYDGPMMAFFQRFLGEPVRHYDFTWFRSVPPGRGTASHCDVIYMGRGEREKLFTAWTPIGDINFNLGGLMILEGSNNHTKLKNSYGQMDIDSYCENKAEARGWAKSWGTGGSLKGEPNIIRRSIGGRWLTSEYRAGDVLIFSMFTVHASLDNRSDRIRLSSDSRYQPASTPADERWIGANPVGHGAAGKKGRIC